VNEELQDMESIGNPSPGGRGKGEGSFSWRRGETATKRNRSWESEEKRMDFGPSKYRNRRCVICPAIHPSRNPPTDSFEEADFE